MSDEPERPRAPRPPTPAELRSPGLNLELLKLAVQELSVRVGAMDQHIAALGKIVLEHHNATQLHVEALQLCLTDFISQVRREFNWPQGSEDEEIVE